VTGPGEGIDIHPPALRAAGERLQTAADRLDELWQQHLTAGERRGEIFGVDPIGSLIGASYRSALDIAHRSYTSVTDDLRGFADVLDGIADAVEETDAGNAADIAEAASAGPQIAGPQIAGPG